MEFRKIVAEAVHFYPRARYWAAVHNSWTDYGADRIYVQEVRAMCQSLALSDGILSRDAFPLMYTAAVLRSPPSKLRALHTLLHTASPEMDLFITDWKSRSPGRIIHDYIDDANTLLSLGARGHNRIVCGAMEFAPGNAREIINKNFANFRPRVVTTGARIRFDKLYSEFICAHIEWMAKFQQ